ncbi:MAG: hypothetical protein JJT75_00670 [Opitutales bacterium]|nr:hypothetical protein [Opitutales bacterium]
MVALNESFALENPERGSKNRVGNFFGREAETRPVNRLPSQQPCREKADTVTIIVSGMFFYGFRYYDPETGRWLNRDPINEIGLMLLRGESDYIWSEDLNLYLFSRNDALNLYDYLGLAYFAYRPLGGWLRFLGVWTSPADERWNTVIGHEQIFFEDGKSPANIGFFDDGTLKTETDTSGYRSPHDSGWNDCIMRKAVAAAPLQDYCLLGKPGTEKFNCQDWADAVRTEYRRLVQDADVIKECCPTTEEKNK